MTGFKKIWPRIAKLGGLSKDVTFRTCFGISFAFACPATLATASRRLPALVGQQGALGYVPATCIRPTSCLLAAGDAVADRTLELMGEGSRRADNSCGPAEDRPLDKPEILGR